MDTNQRRGREFGRYLHKIRTEVFEEALRDFAKRIDLSPSYINKLEISEVSNPKRETVEAIARKLGMEADAMLLKAGYVPDSPQRGEDDEYLLLLIGTLTPGQRAAVRELIRTVKDSNLEVAQAAS